MDQRGTNNGADFGYIALGLFQSQQEIDNAPDQSALGTPRVGDIRYKDLNGDGKIDQNDVTRIGNGSLQTTEYGFGMTATWKQFTVSAFFQGVGGAQRQLEGDGIIPFDNSTGADRGNLYTVAESRWTTENPQAHPFYPRLAFGAAQNANNDVESTWWEKNIDYIRLKTADIDYSLPKSSIKRLYIKGLRLYAQGENLFYWSKFRLWDPELGTANGAIYPLNRTITFGIQADL
jgi:hypothetical protein